MDEFQPHNRETYLSWKYSEAERYERGRVWYLGMGAAGLGLLLYSLVSGNFLFALIVIMFGLVIYLSSIQTPTDTDVMIREDGIHVGGAHYTYSEIVHFWFVYEPPMVKHLYLDFKEPWKPRAIIGLGEQNPNAVRQVLSEFIVEDLTKDEEPLLDAIGRVLKL
jgi:hypothetical protein